ncbi:hypothetical protein [Pseudonocardia humida]|uniref:Uncharacterized protein n=1 Tax=Pseudonocardia humida TaxID=2800819 RepID=A0ABT1A693_9PSEU|nr:hypothetical protein [Pseudonocardia humida]MCO1658542.1 hypothetical protein [Pseudonocardia humida]
MSTSRREGEDQEPAASSAAPPGGNGAQDVVEQPDDAGVDGRTDAEREAADFGGE